MDDAYDKDDRIDIVAEEAVSKQQKQHSQLILTQLTITNMSKKQRLVFFVCCIFLFILLLFYEIKPIKW
jgi:hypothetical protein